MDVNIIIPILQVKNKQKHKKKTQTNKQKNPHTFLTHITSKWQNGILSQI